MASPYGCGESSKKGSLHGVIEKLLFQDLYFQPVASLVTCSPKLARKL